KLNPRLIAAVVLLLAAVGIYIYASRPDPIPDSEDSRTYWFCTSANKGFTLSGSEAQNGIRMQRKAAANDETAPAAFRGGDLLGQVALSPYTHQYTGVEAYKCPKCGEIFPKLDSNGYLNYCPKCKWDPQAPDEDTSKKAQSAP